MLTFQKLAALTVVSALVGTPSVAAQPASVWATGYDSNGQVQQPHESDTASLRFGDATNYDGNGEVRAYGAESGNSKPASLGADGDSIPICKAGTGESYTEAKTKHPELADAIKMIESEGVVTWYSDNKSKSEMMPALERMVKTCSKEERIAIAVYGIPNKDCDAKLSDAGRNKNMDDYKTFIQELKDVIKDRNVLYVLEPDAIGLMPKGGCGSSNGYLEYLQYAATALSENANAQIYLDVGYWIVGANGKETADIVNKIWSSKDSKVKGIVLNTSNYRQTKEMSEVCAAFKKDLGKDLKCVVDTSRNGNGAPGDEWCNAKNTAIGQPPSKPSGFDNVAYNLYVKPPGESDGECTNRNETASMRGPKAGQFFKEHFTQLWNNGYFVKEKGAKKLE